MAPTTRIKVRFFMVFMLAGPQGTGRLVQPLDGDFRALFLDGYHSLAAHGMPLPVKCVVTIPEAFDAHRNLER